MQILPSIDSILKSLSNQEENVISIAVKVVMRHARVCAIVWLTRTDYSHGCPVKPDTNLVAIISLARWYWTVSYAWWCVSNLLVTVRSLSNQATRSTCQQSRGGGHSRLTTTKWDYAVIQPDLVGGYIITDTVLSFVVKRSKSGVVWPAPVSLEFTGVECSYDVSAWNLVM